MTFPSDYKVVKLPGSTSGVLDVYNGFERQLLIDTEAWTLRLMDGTTPGGFPVVHLRDFETIFTDSNYVEQGTRLSVEVATASGVDTDLIAASAKVRPWSPLVIRTLFEKLANTATAGTWRILDAALPEPLQQAAAEVLDMDDAITDGFYTVDPSVTANIPGAISTSTTRNLAVMVTAQSTDNVMQMLVERDNSAKIWIRVRLDGAWQAWVLATGVTSTDLAAKVSKSGDTMTGPLDMGNFAISRILSINGGPVHAVNEADNGDLVVAQRGTTQTTSAYGSVDRWLCSHVGSTRTFNRLANVLGDSAHGTKFYGRHVVASVAGASNYAAWIQRKEDVLRWAGKRITVTFEAKADSAKDIALSMDQIFGTGGSPSASVTGIGAQRVTLGTGWQKYSLVFDLPSVSGKVLGTNNDDCTQVWFWLDAGSTFNARTANLGQQSGTFDLRHISFRIGDARGETDPFIWRSTAEEELNCERFLEAGVYNEIIGVTNSSIVGSVYTNVSFRVRKRALPTVSGTVNIGTFAVTSPTVNGVGVGRSSAEAQRTNSGTYLADAEL